MVGRPMNGGVSNPPLWITGIMGYTSSTNHPNIDMETTGKAESMGSLEHESHENHRVYWI